MKALLCGDIHLSDRPPSIRTESYTDDILNKLEFCVAQANDRADVLVLLGDVFHLKAPAKTSHRLVMRTAEVLERFNGRVLIVPGNHDLSQDRLESLESQPLGSLALSPNVTLLMGYDEATGIFAIPYLHDWGQSLNEWMDRFGGVEPGDGTEDQTLPDYEIPSLLVTHAPIFPPGDEPPYDFIAAADWASQMRWNVPVAYGHIHDQHGFYQAGGVWFCNNGAISRGSLHEETLKREPRVTIFDSDTLERCPFTSVPVPHRPTAEVFRLTEHVEKVAAEQRLDEFLTSIGEVSLTALSLEEVLGHAAMIGLSNDARSELAAILDFAVHG